MSEKKLAYKCFDNDLKCHGYQFEIGKTYINDGKVKACESVFHACLNPIDVLSYYDITQRFAKVELGGEMSTHGDDSKISSAEITIKAELKLPEFISDCINFIKDCCKSDIQPSGNGSKLAASGNYSKLAASGYGSNLAASGNGSKLAASGYGSKLAASGNDSKLAASGNDSKLAASGYGSNLAASGNDSNLAASGNDSNLAASGNYSNLAASGNDSNLAASGNYSNLAASGNGSKLAASGYGSNLAASGYGSKLAASGNGSIAMSCGLNSYVKGGINCALALTRWVESESRYRISVAYVGEDGIKADTWYKLDDAGKFVEVK